MACFVDEIQIKGARQHNLQNIEVSIPRGKLTVITGPSGSGKSSLAFHTLYAEGQRRYVESLSSYARQFLDQFDKPDVDSIEGLSPAIAIDQRNGVSNPRSTIATSTEIYDYLRVLFSAVGVPHDPATGQRLEKLTSLEIVRSLSRLPEKSKLMLLASVPLSETGDFSSLKTSLQKQGYVRVRINGEVHELDEIHHDEAVSIHQFEVVVDRLAIREGVESRLADSVEASLRMCGSQLIASVMRPGDNSWSDQVFMTSYRNPETGFEMPEISPKHFSFNSRVGACPHCHGLGTELSCDPGLIVPDPTKSITGGAVAIWKGSKKKQSWQGKKIQALAETLGANVEAPFSSLPEHFKRALFYGTGEKEIQTMWEKEGYKLPHRKAFEGLCHTVERFARESKSNAVRKSMNRFMRAKQCPCCAGQRLKPEILAVRLPDPESKVDRQKGLNIHELCSLSVEDALGVLKGQELPGNKGEALQGVMHEILRRLEFLDEVGLSYLNLNRPSNSLSGGESQRIRLATQIGAGLSGVIYVLDEPSIGLHPADNRRLIQALLRLRDIGNTVVVVEHDEDTIRAADWLIDIGPGAGSHGGSLLAAGTPEQVIANKESITGQWLSGVDTTESAPGPAPTPTPAPTGELIIRGAREHNLAGMDVSIPLGMMVLVTGVSGSGKSTLIDHILRRALARYFYHSNVQPGEHESIEGLESLDKMIVVDQKPLGRSPRSNPATYTGAFDLIRGLFAKLPLSRQRGYQAGRFSFNMKGGRCEKCQGDGQIRIDMHFLSDAYVTCDACSGKRYNRETLEVTYKGRNIAEILEMTAEEASSFFDPVPKLKRILQALCDVGLGYVHLGQAANSLSGGEAQRVKIADELSKPNQGHCLYLLDEPTTGLHYNDVRILLKVLKRLRDDGNSLVIVEHNLDVIRSADWVIDLGPGGGKHGGQVVGAGTPDDLAQMPASRTGAWLKSGSTT
ncbi:excinuclease ABC subunit UvrA [Verrucomicrobiaceae bacterium N1E253]|uniref:UvrABC system protein A n=1 Tax=Oceaniferula marina TaxID=2748318 RepID=A0A851GEX3_9BACT|nr:excinuclease ABC subunit UvrA [Oceaniferula marina]NWK54281.1 excinuclease ABC subunit UvrA [Oceaniferula marina]